MKKILYLLILMLFIPSYKLNFSLAENEKFYYAKIEHEGYFYSSPEGENKLFQIPTSYFVLLTGEENSQFYKAEYKDLSGFVKKSEVSPMSGTPTSPYPIANFRVFAKEGLGLFPTPSSSSSPLCTIPYLYGENEFYGYMTGEEDVPNKSNQWLYCKHLSYVGYTYSVFCDSLPIISKNQEIFDIVNPTFSTPVQSLSNSSLVWIFVGVGVPSVIVLLLLVKPTLVKQRILSGNSKRKDYFEFDDNSLN